MRRFFAQVLLAHIPAVVLLAAPAPSFAFLSEEQKQTAEQLISLFENGTPQVQYDYVENIDDGRGYTCGRAGFTTATGDAFLLVDEYTKQKPSNPLAPYLPRLKELARAGSGSNKGLEGFDEAFRRAAKDPMFIGLQDQIQDDLYYYPAMEAAQALGLQTALSKAVLYDTIIQHGQGGDPDSLGTIIARTERVLGGSPKQGSVSEAKFLVTFLRIRRAVLTWPQNSESRQAWAQSAGRVDVFWQLIRRRNLDLRLPLHVQTDEYDEWIR